MGFLTKVVVNAMSLYLASAIYPAGMMLRDLRTTLVAAVLFGIVNAVVRPVALLLSIPLTLLTLGLFILVVNTAMLYIVVALLRIEHGSFAQLFVISLIVSVISFVLSSLVG
jgi:putative membrane protein